MRNFFKKRRNVEMSRTEPPLAVVGSASAVNTAEPVVPPAGPVARLSPMAPVRHHEAGPGPHVAMAPSPALSPLRSASDRIATLNLGPRQAVPSRREPEREPDQDIALPQFQLPVAGALRGAPVPSGPISPEAHAALREAFTPTRPKSQVNALFIGRMQILRRIIQAIEEERAHVVLYGDRGRGKTSAANAIQQIAAQAGYLTIKLTCSAELGFEDIFRKLLSRIPSTYHQSGVDNPFSARRSFGNFDELLPPGSFSATELQEVLAEISGTHVLFILDEYDRVTGEDVRNKLAELIKNLTDASVPVTLLIVGVAETVNQLLGKHPSIQRSLVSVHLPLMSGQEVDRLILAGAEAAGITFPADVRERIALFAKGLPYYGQLLSLHTARNALGRGDSTVTMQDLAYGVQRCVAEAERSVVDAYTVAVGTDRRTSFADVLYLAAQCPADEFGVFNPADMAQVPLGPDKAGMPLLSLQYPLSRLVEPERGAVLERIAEAGGFRYRFRHQMMRQYVLMRQARERGLL
ncbi:MAG TPA: AAA family ATPase [Azospirillaceae bacterium]|nr:AAA family ATPase [Azospirillaceae bacterium]